MPHQPAIAAIPDWSLDEALAAVARVFDANELTNRKISLDDVAAYYKQSDRGYRLFHSSQGALHIALGCDGHDDTKCFSRQAELFAQHLQETGAIRAIEFGCGMGFNTRWVARHLPECQVRGVDLTSEHIAYCQQQSADRSNLSYEQANYEKLVDDANTFGGVLAVETLCQTTNMKAALREAFRVLTPGGRLVVVDCFRSAPLEQFSPANQQAALLVEKATAVDCFSVFDEWRALCQTIGFVEIAAVDHSAETEQNLRRLHRLARKFFKLPRAVTALARAFPQRLLENSACGLMMPYTVGAGVHVYCSAVFEKPIQ